jgi:hypothetical protein
LGEAVTDVAYFFVQAGLGFFSSIPSRAWLLYRRFLRALMSDNADFIEVYPNALPLELCDRLVETFEKHQGVYQGRTGAGVDLSKKNSHDLMLDSHPELNSLKSELMQHTFAGIKRYFEKYSMALIGAVSINVENELGNSVTLNPDNFTRLGKPKLGDIISHLYRSGTINIQRYKKGKGGYPHWHSEQYPQADGYEALHRVVLYMYYLNDVDEGGETEFYYQAKKINPSKGTMVVAPASFTHSHRGNTPISDDKYIATSWILFNRKEKIYD